LYNYHILSKQNQIMLINYPYTKYSHLKKFSLIDEGRIKYAQSIVSLKWVKKQP